MIKKGLAVVGNTTNINNAKQKQASTEHKKQVASDEAKVLASQLAKVEVTLPVKIGEGGKVFGSINSKDISDAIKTTYDVIVDKKKIEIKDPLKTLGTHEVLVRVHPEITATIKVIIVEG